MRIITFNTIMNFAICYLLLIALVGGSWVVLASGPDTEIDDLALQFQNGFNSVNGKLRGQESSNLHGPPTIGDVDEKMHDLYVNLERDLVDARQRAANARSSLTTKTIDRLKLM